MAFNMILSGPKMIMHKKTIAEMFMIQLENNKGLFSIDCITGEEHNYPTLKKDVLAMAYTLQNEHFGCGDIVMTTDYSSYEGQVVILAGLLIGATISALDYTLKQNILTELINESKPDVIFCSTSSINIISDILSTTKHQPRLKVSTEIRDEFALFSNIISTENLFVYSPKIVSTNFPCALIFSSGTTGIPKGIYLSDNAIKAALTSFKSLMEEPNENKFMTSSPIFWYTGILLLMLGIHFGKPRLFFSVKPTTEQILFSIDKFKPTFLMTNVATVKDMMSYQMMNDYKYNIKSLMTLVVGGAPLKLELQKIITKDLLQDRIPIKQGYGATEQGIIALCTMQSDINTVKYGSVGRPVAGIKIKVVNLDSGQCVGPNIEGEIRIKSVSNMIGYANDMKKTINSYDEDGWFKSGDIGYYTNDGYLFITSRIKELMIYNHQRIAPINIEMVLLSHPAVLDAGVTSKDSLEGDLLIGVVKIKSDQNIKPDQLESYVNDKVKDHEKLRGGLIFVDNIPRSPAGKLKRDELKQLVK